MIHAAQPEPVLSKRPKSLVLLWPDDLFEPSIREQYKIQVFERIMSIIEKVNNHRGEMVVVDSEYSIYQDGYFRYQIDRKLFELASAGYSVRKVLQVEEDEFSSPEAVEEWQGFGGYSENLVYLDKTELWNSLTPILNNTDVLLLGGMQESSHNPGDTTIHDAANAIRWLCKNTKVFYPETDTKR